MEWFPDLSLETGLWHAQVSVTGSEPANTLEDDMYDDAGELVLEDGMVSPERWLVAAVEMTGGPCLTPDVSWVWPQPWSLC